MLSCAWIWMYVGAFLMLAELLAPGFVIFFFGLSAATVGAIRAVAGEPFGLSWQFAAFSVFSIVYLVILRRWLKNVFMGDKSDAQTGVGSDYVGRVGKVTTAICPPLAGRMLIGDAEWTAEATTEIPAGATVKVISQNNLTMKVEVI